MRVLILANNWLGWQIARLLKEHREEIVGVVVHPEPKQKFSSELLETVALHPSCVFGGDQLHRKDILESISNLKPEIAVSVLFDYILRKPFLDIIPQGVINLHPALLPYNRGQYPNVWSIVEGTPAGVTLHYIDEGVDTGDIIAQREVPVCCYDTGESLYRKLEQASVGLFEEAWPAVRTGTAQRRTQVRQAGTSHRTRDVQHIDEIDLDGTYVARDLINILRARTFPPYDGAYFRAGGGRVYVRVELVWKSDE